MADYNPGINDPMPVQPFYSTINRLENPSTIGSGLELRQSTIPNSGMGVFSTRYFKIGDVVTFYDGKVFMPSSATRQRIRNTNRPDGSSEDSHVIYIRDFDSGDWLIDGVRSSQSTNGVGAGSLMNSRQRAGANVKCNVDNRPQKRMRMQYANQLHSGPRDPLGKSVPPMNMYAKRDIMPGEELFWDYPVA